MILAQDIMSKNIISVKDTTPIKELAATLFKNNISGVPVMNEQDKVIGVVTENDLIDQNKKIHIPTAISFLDGFFLLGSPKKMEEELKKMAGITAGDICSKELISVNPETPLEDIATIMAENKIHTLPVIDNEKLVGIIGKGDIIRAIATS